MNKTRIVRTLPSHLDLAHTLAERYGATVEVVATKGETHGFFCRLESAETWALLDAQGS